VHLKEVLHEKEELIKFWDERFSISLLGLHIMWQPFTGAFSQFQICKLSFI